MTKEMTKGSILKLIFEFSVPILFGLLFQQFYNVVDTIIVGKALGVEALAAVGSTGSVNFLIIGFCVGICAGFAIPVARRFGARENNEMRKFTAASVVLSSIIAVILTIATVIYCRPLLHFMKTPLDIFDRANSYISIIYTGIPFIILFNMVSSILRAVGNSRTPLVFLVIASIINIILDLLFILVFKWDVAGAAVATVVAQGIAGVICLIYMYHKFEVLRLSKSDWNFNRHHIIQLCKDGIPMGLQFTITAVGSVILQVAVNGLGSVIVAVVTTAQRIGMFFFTPFDALGTTMATFTGQNTGAMKFDRLRKGVIYSCLIGVGYSLIAFLTMFFFSENFASIFIDNSNAEIIRLIGVFLKYMTGFYVFLAFVHIIRFSIQGMGFSGLAIFAGVFEMIGRSIVGLFFVPIYGFTAVLLASPLAWILADIFLIPAFFYCLNRLRRQNECKGCSHAEIPPVERPMGENPFLS